MEWIYLGMVIFLFVLAAFDLLESVPPERNFITRSWAKAGLTADNASDSQALIQLKREYCDPKDCLRCRFGGEYLRRKVGSRN